VLFYFTCKGCTFTTPFIELYSEDNMAEEKDSLEKDNEGDKPEEKPATPKTPEGNEDAKFTKEDVNARVDEALKDIKDKLNALDSKNKDLKVELAKRDEKAREAEIESLKNEGKHKEAMEKQIEDLTAELTALRGKNTELTRDNQVNALLSSQDFRGDRARDMAVQEITKSLVRNDNGEWVAKDGASIKDYVDTFVKDENNKFLFKQPTSGGTGQGTLKESPLGSNTDKDFLNRPLKEAFDAARQGKLPNQQKS